MSECKTAPSADGTRRQGQHWTGRTPIAAPAPIVGDLPEKGKSIVMYTLSLEKKSAVIRALVDGASVRGAARIVGVDRETVMNLGAMVGNGCAQMHDAFVRSIRCESCEADEIWAFCIKKQARVVPGFDPWFSGDVYTFTGIDADTKLCISYLTGKRTPYYTQKFCYDLATRIVGDVQINTDGWRHYANSIDDAFGSRATHAVVMKKYESDHLNRSAAHRYSPGRVVSIEKYASLGSPDESRVSTSYVERQNLTMRMAMRRFTRLTNAFSRKLENLRAAVALHFAYVNWVRIHETLGVTPAVAAGLSDHAWTIEELVSFVLTIPAADPWIGLDDDMEVA